MKKELLILFVLFLPLVSFAQTAGSVEGFFGVKFGSGAEVIKNSMKDRGYSPEIDKSDFIAYLDVMFGGKKSSYVLFRLIDNKMFEGQAVFSADIEAQTVDLYESISDDIEYKYGNGESFERYDTPYEKGDGYTTTAISLGKAHFNTYWLNLNGGNISLGITHEHTVELTYQDNVLVDEAIERQKEKKASDF